MAIYSEFSIVFPSKKNWWFSIATLNYQRVTVEPSKTHGFYHVLHCFTRKKKRLTHHFSGDLTINTGGLTTKHGDVMGYNLESKEFLYPNSLIQFSWHLFEMFSGDTAEISSKIVLDIYSSIQSTCHMHAPCVMIVSVRERERMSVLVLPFITSSRFKHVFVSKSFTKGLNVWCASHDSISMVSKKMLRF